MLSELTKCNFGVLPNQSTQKLYKDTNLKFFELVTKPYTKISQPFLVEEIRLTRNYLEYHLTHPNEEAKELIFHSEVRRRLRRQWPQKKTIMIIV